MMSPRRNGRAGRGVCALALAGLTSVACSGAPTPSIDDNDDLEGTGGGTTHTTTTTTSTTGGSSPGVGGGSADGDDDDQDGGAAAGDASMAGHDGGSGLDASTGGGSPPKDASTGPEASAPTGHHPPTVPPTRTCSYSPDSSGYFTMTTGDTSYVVRLPASYDKTKPYPVIIGTHGCGDNAQNFCSWAPAAYNQSSNVEENDILNYIAVSVEDTAGGCWQIADAGKVIAALDDVISCFYVDQARVTAAGYSSGAGVAYEVGLANASRFAGILIEEGALYDNGSNEAPLLANASWKINIAHIQHTTDDEYPLAKVQPDWDLIKAAGFPIQTFVTDEPGHSGTSLDWYGTLDPLITTSKWVAP